MPWFIGASRGNIPAAAGQRLAPPVESFTVLGISCDELVTLIYTPAVLLRVEIAAAEIAAASLQQVERFCICLTCRALS